MAAMKPRTGDGPMEAVKEGRLIIVRVPLEGGGRLVVSVNDAEAKELGAHLREGCKALPDPKPVDQFDYVFTEMTEELATQRDGFAAYLESFEEVS